MIGYAESFLLGAIAGAGLSLFLILWLLSRVSKSEYKTDR
jgi:hypothetical protein